MIMTPHNSAVMVSSSKLVRSLCGELGFVCDVNYPDINGCEECLSQQLQAWPISGTVSFIVPIIPSKGNITAHSAMQFSLSSLDRGDYTEKQHLKSLIHEWIHKRINW